MGNRQASLSRAEKRGIIENYGINEDMVKEITKIYNKVSKEGKFSRDKFQNTFKTSLVPEFSDQIYNYFAKSDEKMTLQEFVKMLAITYGGSAEQKLRVSFELFNKSCDGALTKKEVKEMFVIVLKQKWRIQHPNTQTTPPSMTDEELTIIDNLIDVVFENADTKKDGTLDVDEYVASFTTNPEMCHFFMQF